MLRGSHVRATLVLRERGCEPSRRASSVLTNPQEPTHGYLQTSVSLRRNRSIQPAFATPCLLPRDHLLPRLPPKEVSGGGGTGAWGSGPTAAFILTPDLCRPPRVQEGFCSSPHHPHSAHFITSRPGTGSNTVIREDPGGGGGVGGGASINRPPAQASGLFAQTQSLHPTGLLGGSKQTQGTVSRKLPEEQVLNPQDPSPKATKQT